VVQNHFGFDLDPKFPRDLPITLQLLRCLFAKDIIAEMPSIVKSAKQDKTDVQNIYPGLSRCPCRAFVCFLLRRLLDLFAIGERDLISNCLYSSTNCQSCQVWFPMLILKQWYMKGQRIMDAQKRNVQKTDDSPLWPLRLAVFDLDGTLKEASSPWMYLHKALGFEQEAEQYRARFFAGEIDYLEWARLDTALWKGIELTKVEDVFRASPYRPGVHALFEFLRRNNVRTAVISTGLDVHARQVAAELGLWRTIANELIVQDGCLTGEAIVHVMEHTKGQWMAQLREEVGARIEECLAVGDGPADVHLFAQAGLAIAVCPRDERVRQAAHFVIGDGDLARIIPLVKGHFLIQP